MEKVDVYDALNDLASDLLGMAFELQAMAAQAEAEYCPDPLPLESGEIAAFESLSDRLIACAETAHEAERAIEYERTAQVIPFAAMNGGAGNE